MRKDGKQRPTDSPKAAINVDIQVRIGRNLKEYYQHVVNDPVPDRLRSLVDELEKHAPKSKTPRTDDKV